MTLRLRVALLVAAVVTVAVAAVGWSALRSARAELTEEVDHDLLERGALVIAEPGGDFWSRGPGRSDRRLGPRLRQDPLGSLVSFDAFARVVVTDLDAGVGGAIQGGEVILTFDDDIGTVPDVSRLERARRDGLVLETVRVGGFRLRLMTVAAGDGVFVQVARPLEEVENALRDLQRQVLTFGSLAVAAAAVGAWFLAGRTVRPIVRLTVTAEQIAETGDVDRPVEGLGTGEVGRLARSFRTMLAANAVKFSEGGPVDVVVDGGSVTVHDAGPGVGEADRERIFERFHRLEADRDQPGSGLGLAIVRQVAEAHGGTVWAGASPLGGAAVGLRIPEMDD